MEANVYEEYLIGRAVNDDCRPPKPSVIDMAIRAIGRQNYRSEPRGHYIWADGRWNGPLKLDGLMRAANEKLLRQGKPQISVNPTWLVEIPA
jgi:hypothetical protein